MKYFTALSRRKWLVRILAGLFVALLLGGAVAWFFPQQVLLVESGEVPADAIVVLGGTPDRPVRAAELYRQGAAPKVVVSGFGDTMQFQQILETNGVPHAAIVVETDARSTRENAKLSIPLLRHLGAKRVIIVTSWYHSRRAQACFEHYAPDLTFYSRPSYFGYVGESAEMRKPVTGSQRPETGDRRPETGDRAEWKAVRGYTNAEYVKLVGYWVCYGVWPFLKS